MLEKSLHLGGRENMWLERMPHEDEDQMIALMLPQIDWNKVRLDQYGIAV